MKLTQLAGNEALKKQLSAQAEGRGLSHAYLISGPAGSGKKTLARLMAAAMVCTGAGEAPCGTCPACKKALGNIHPDIITVAGEDGKDISVGQARALRSDAYIRPNEADRKVYLIMDAQNMNTSAQNAVLKLLEEGPPYAAFLLLTDNLGALLPTIRSRCEGLSLTPVSPGEAEEFLLRRFPDKPATLLREEARACEGILGRAVKKLEGGNEDDPIPQTALDLLALMAKREELGLCAKCVALEKLDRDSLTRLFETLLSLLRDVLKLQAGGTVEPLPAQVKAAAKQLPGAALCRCVALLEDLRRHTDFNVGAGHLCGALSAALSQALSL
ncbi:MAG: DNA polymerase III subunit delta [Oscillospiraceae bacterium]|nr:DNA polymerase III subunit delta [Oscillospiraceae bacterium]